MHDFEKYKWNISIEFGEHWRIIWVIVTNRAGDLLSILE